MNDGLRLYQRLLGLVAGLGLCGIAGAASPPASCVAPDYSTVTTCFLDLTGSGSGSRTLGSEVLGGGLFRVPGADDVGQDFGTLQPFVRIQMQDTGRGRSGGVQAPRSGGNGNGNPGGGSPGNQGNWNTPIRLGDIPKVTVCDGGGSTGANCREYYEFLLNVTAQAGSSLSGISLDEFKLFVEGRNDIQDLTTGSGTPPALSSSSSSPSLPSSSSSSSGPKRAVRAPLRVQPPRGTEVPLTGATLKYDMDTASGGDASVLIDYTGNSVDLQALVPVSNFSGVSADSLVYLLSKFDQAPSQCPQPCKTPDSAGGVGKLDFSGGGSGFAEWLIRGQGGPGAQNPVPATALLLALGLAGLVSVRRVTRAGRSPA